MHGHHHHLPNGAAMANLSIDGLMQTTRRLNDILLQESEHLAEMRIKELAPLQEEKSRLTKLLETYQAALAGDANFIKRADHAAREELLLMTDDLAFTVEENFRRTSVARAVNNRVMQAIMEVMTEQHRPATYGPQGQTTAAPDLALSLNLNQKA